MKRIKNRNKLFFKKQFFFIADQNCHSDYTYVGWSAGRVARYNIALLTKVHVVV